MPIFLSSILRPELYFWAHSCPFSVMTEHNMSFSNRFALLLLWQPGNSWSPYQAKMHKPNFFLHSSLACVSIGEQCHNSYVQWVLALWSYNFKCWMGSSKMTPSRHILILALLLLMDVICCNCTNEPLWASQLSLLFLWPLSYDSKSAFLQERRKKSYWKRKIYVKPITGKIFSAESWLPDVVLA